MVHPNTGLGSQPSLPPEIVSAIIHQLSKSTNTYDQVYAWMDCRLLSKQLKKEIEDVFCKVHLPKTYFRFDRDGGWAHRMTDVWFDFVRLSDDGATAVFVRSKTRDRPTAYELKTIFQKLAKPKEKRIIEPSHVVRIRRDLNDSAIPQTSLKMKSQEIHVDWKQLYNLYFREKRNHDRLVEQWGNEIGDAWVEESRARFARGEIDMYTQLQEAVTKFGDAASDCQIQARRVRISQQYQNLMRQPLVIDKAYLRREDRAVTKLREESNLLMFEESDDEDVDHFTQSFPDEQLEEIESEQEGLGGERTYDVENDSEWAQSDWSSDDDAVDSDCAPRSSHQAQTLQDLLSRIVDGS